ncbi:hypothetical protein GUJ93_ZPchr0007g5069 [Zizania palustris]|uniref:Uncharacterized protein n=1 Tax=Zizania palustris TaxID=103762 RepID=A0A8J5VR94_ZIZPA|nr:hypothetical protein GUJ93_ZPchr0007g5069 [Zizania palustris]
MPRTIMDYSNHGENQNCDVNTSMGNLNRLKGTATGSAFLCIIKNTRQGERVKNRMLVYGTEATAPSTVLLLGHHQDAI